MTGRATNNEGLAPWLKQHLIATGVIDDNGIGRRAVVRTCVTCRATILTGLDADTAALTVRVDPIPLSPLGEALARVDGRPTYWLHRDGGRLVLDLRDAWNIHARPAGTRLGEDILRAHQCGSPPVAGPLEAETQHPSARPAPISKECPF